MKESEQLEVQTTWNKIKNTKQTFKIGILDFQHNNKRKEWITTNILELMDERKKHKTKTVETEIKRGEEYIERLFDNVRSQNYDINGTCKSITKSYPRNKEPKKNKKVTALDKINVAEIRLVVNRNDTKLDL